MHTFKNSPFFLFLLSCLFVSSITAQQHPLFLKQGQKVKVRQQSKPLFSSRITGTDSVGFGGEPGVVWERLVKEVFPQHDEIYLTDILTLADGLFAVSGIIDSSSYTFPFVIKCSDQGKVNWSKRLDSYKNYGQYPGLFATKDSGIILGGVLSPDLGQGFLILKLNKDGEILWQKLDNEKNNPMSGCSIDFGIDGGYIISGRSPGDVVNDSCTTQRDTFNIAIIKIDSIGNIEWRKKQFIGLSPSGQLDDISVVKMNDGYIIGTTHIKDGNQCPGNMDNSLDFVVMKYNLSGNLIWKKEYGGNRYEYMSGMIKISDKEVLMFGETNSIDGNLLNINNDSTRNSGWLLSLNDTGKVVLNHVYNLSSKQINSLYSAFQDTDSTYTLAGGEFFIDSINQSYDGFTGYVIRMKNNGSVIWSASFPGKAIFEIKPAKGKEIGYVGYIFSKESYSFGKLGQTNNITGSIYYDFNKNNIKDTNEPYANKFLVTSEKAAYSRSSVSTNGWFRNDVDTGIYKTTVKLNNDYYVAVPAEKQTTFTTLFQNDTVHFALQPVAGKRDLSISLIPVTAARPGFNANYKLTFRNNGTDTVPNGAIVLIKDSRTTSVSSLPAAGLIMGDSILWAYTGLKPFDNYSIDVELKLSAPPTLNNGDTVRYKAFITSTTGSAAAVDLTPLDDTANVAQLVTGSYDPNDKQENVAGKILQAKVATGEDIQYVIRFQNTGTDTAFTVRITDTLDTKLNWNSFQMITASHQYKMTVSDGNKITWIFNDINLPDSNVNQLLSNGFIAFKIKAKTNLNAGDYFQNKASIYFDYNLPVLTNTATTVVSTAVITNVRDLVNNDMQLVAMPNPSSGELYMKLSGKLTGKFEYSVIDLFGRVLQSSVVERTSVQDQQLIPLHLNHLSAGVYYVVLRQKEKIWQQKIILQ